MPDTNEIATGCVHSVSVNISINWDRPLEIEGAKGGQERCLRSEAQWYKRTSFSIKDLQVVLSSHMVK
jgi:hypothetical protein